MEKLNDLGQIAKFARNDRTPFLCVCEKCKKTFVMQVRSLKEKDEIICKPCTQKITSPECHKDKANNTRKQTCLKKFGTESFFQSKEFKDKSKNTCIKKYGCEYITQSKEFIEKALKSRQERYGDVSFNAKYFYNDIWFDSSWELAYFIWLTDANQIFEYHPKAFHKKYVTSDGKEHLYFPDFIVNGEYQEIKGKQFFNEKGEPFDLYSKTFWWEKYNFLKENNIRIIKQEDMKFIFDYIEKTYGKNYLKQFNLGKYVRK